MTEIMPDRTHAARPVYDGIVTPWLTVSDLRRSIEWYQSNLGLEVLFRADEIGWCELSTDTENVAVGLWQADSGFGRGGAMLTFGVRDLIAEKARLQARGVEFGQPAWMYEGLVAMETFFDPDGNPIMFCQVLHEPRN
ncbi:MULTISPECIES: VOC family protein [unclassified Nocardia]|uniref:VOC family protein n=1 Tax=unclassified Nocardia TaxID=2637762 RepID=UPI0035DE4481